MINNETLRTLLDLSDNLGVLSVLAGFAPMTSFVTVLVLVPVCSFLMMKFFVFRT